MADNNTSINDATAARISTLTGVSKACIDAVSAYESPPSQVSVDSASKEAVGAVVHMLAELGPDATADDFRTQLNLLNESIPALEAQAEQAATSDDGFKAQLRHLSSQCDFAIQILDDEKTKYLGNLSVLNQELRAKMAAAGGAFDGDWNALEATDDWPSDAAEQLHRLVENYPQVEKREGYLNEVSAYWKEFAGKEAAQLYQKGWEYVAGYKLKWEY